ncbi:MAG: hypothetical protein HY314_10460 [Acidobacteria bacterium]|nr:hypothetical protein [Acidobacteriota bacterium]
MERIEISTPEPQKVLPILRDAIERQKQLLAQSLAQTQERVRQLAADLHVDPDLLMAGEIPHSEEQDMDLLELEGELELLRHLREQLESLERLTLCP